MSTKVEFTPEEKALFIANNFKVTFWAERELITAFDTICKQKGLTRKDGMIKLIQKFVEKNTK